MINLNFERTISLAPVKDLYWYCLGGIAFLGAFGLSFLSLIAAFAWIGSMIMPTDYFFISLVLSPISFGGSIFFSRKAAYCLEQAGHT